MSGASARSRDDAGAESNRRETEPWLSRWQRFDRRGGPPPTVDATAAVEAVYEKGLFSPIRWPHSRASPSRPTLEGTIACRENPRNADLLSSEQPNASERSAG